MNYTYNFYLLRSTKSVDDIRYIGVTIRSLNCRYAQHKHEAFRKAGRPVYNWWNNRIQDGYKIIIEPIETNFSGDWESEEKYWIRHYKQMGFKLLNLSEGGAGIVTVEQRTKSSRQRSIEAHNKAVIALTKDGKFYKEYKSCMEASKDLNLCHTAITNACSNRWSRSSHGFIWVFKDQYDPNKDYSYKKTLNINCIKCYKFNSIGVLLKEYTSKQECIEENKIDGRMLTRVIENKNIYKDFIYSYSKEINLKEYTPYKKWSKSK